MNDHTTDRRRFLASIACSPLAIGAGPTTKARSTVPRLVAPADQARRLVELADRIMETGWEQGRLQAESDRLYDEYRDHHEVSGDCPPGVHLRDCTNEECDRLWRAYSEAETLARAVNDDRSDLYMEVKVAVFLVLEEAGIEPPDIVAILGRALRPLAVVEAGVLVFSLIGSPSFNESCTYDDWGDTEVVIDDL